MKTTTTILRVRSANGVVTLLNLALVTRVVYLPADHPQAGPEASLQVYLAGDQSPDESGASETFEGPEAERIAALLGAIGGPDDDITLMSWSE